MMDITKSIISILIFLKSLRIVRISYFVFFLIVAVIISWITNHLQILFLPKDVNYLPILNKEHFCFITSSIVAYFVFIQYEKLSASFSRLCANYQEDYIVNENDWGEKFSQDWEGQGNIYILKKDKKNMLGLTDCQAGYLLKPNHQWFNFTFSINMHFDSEIRVIDTEKSKNKEEWLPKVAAKREIMSIIFRAQSLDDYYMVGIWKIRDEIFIKPHLKVDGIWRQPEFISPTSHQIQKQSKDSFHFVLEVKGSIARLSIDDKEAFKWLLPSKYYTSDPRENINLKDGFIHNVPFATRAGAVGLRNYGDEYAIIENLEVKRLKL